MAGILAVFGIAIKHGHPALVSKGKMDATPPIDILSLFLLGLLGTGHCLGMCGPLVVALPGRFGGWTAHVAYHSGRILTYTVIGAVMGAVGTGLAGLAALTATDPLVWILRIQAGMSTVAGLFLVAFGLMRLHLLPEPAWLAVATPAVVPGYRRILAAAMDRRHYPWLLVTGMMMGLLPCGLSFAAFSRTLAAGSMSAGLILAAAFGLGTLPGLLAIGTGFGALFRRYQSQTEILAALVMLFMGVRLLVVVWIRG